MALLTEGRPVSYGCGDGRVVVHIRNGEASGLRLLEATGQYRISPVGGKPISGRPSQPPSSETLGGEQ